MEPANRCEPNKYALRTPYRALRSCFARGRWQLVALALLIWAPWAPLAAQEMKLPKDVDFGGSGLVRFNYECEKSNCNVRCFMTGALVLDVKDAQSATFTSYRSHGRQNAPEKEIFVTSKTEESHYINFAGDGGCVFAGMKQQSTTGFVSRTSR